MFEQIYSNFTVNNSSYGEVIINISEREGYTPILAIYAAPGGGGGTWWICVTPQVVVLNNDNIQFIAMMRRINNTTASGTFSASFIIVYKKSI